MLMALALLPPEVIVSGFRYLEEIAVSKEAKKLCVYYEKHWIKKWGCASYSVFKRNIRTNNDLEGYHNALNRMVGHNTNIWKLINELLWDVEEFKNQVDMIGIGQTSRVVNKKQRMVEKSLKTAFAHFETTGDVLMLMRYGSHQCTRFGLEPINNARNDDDLSQSVAEAHTQPLKDDMTDVENCQVETTRYRCHGYQLSEADMDTLQPGRWLNDQIVNAYIAKLAAQTANICALSTFVYVMLVKRGMEETIKMYQQTLRDSVGMIVLMPINEPGHWTLVVASITDRRILYLNSLPVLTGSNEVVNNVEQLFRTVHGGQWLSVTSKNIPKQRNGFDCGMFVLSYAESICKRRKFTMTQDDMPGYRVRVMAELKKTAS